ncbi:MAG TPA: hypothetical protein VF635_02630 [Propionibacteriaceae bacterium]
MSRPASETRRPAAAHLGALVAAVGLLFAALPGPAHAEPLTLELTTLGQQNSIALPGAAGFRTLTLPVPDGLQPAELRGIADVASDQSAGVLDITDSSRRIFSMNLGAHNGRTIAFNVSLTGTPVVDHAVTVRLALSMAGCRDVNTRGTVLRNLVLSYGGHEAVPRSIAEFLPPVLRKLDIYLAPDAPMEAQESAVTLASVLTARYNPAAPVMRVRRLTVDGPTQPLEQLSRAVILNTDGQPGMTLQPDGRTLQITGSGSELLGQVNALSNDLGRIAQSSRADASRIQSRPELPSATQTLSDLGLGEQSATGTGSATATLGVDSATLGASASDWTTHLLGVITTEAPSDGSASRGTLTLTGGGRTLESWPIPENGHFEVRPSVPEAVLSRYTELGLTATVSGNGGCADRPAVTITLDPASSITANRNPQSPFGGFTDLPGALRPTYQVAAQDSSVAALGDLVGVVVAVQRLTQVRLNPQLVDVPTLIASKLPALLVVNSRAPSGMDLPLVDDGTTISLGNGEQLRSETQMATVQVTTGAGRYLAVVSGSTQALVAGLLQWLSSPGHLSDLRGDVAVFSPSGDVRTLSVHADQAADGRSRPAGIKDTLRSGGLSLAVGVPALLVLIVAAALWRRRRPGPGGDRSTDENWSWG